MLFHLVYLHVVNTYFILSVKKTGGERKCNVSTVLRRHHQAKLSTTTVVEPAPRRGVHVWHGVAFMCVGAVGGLRALLGGHSAQLVFL